MSKEMKSGNADKFSIMLLSRNVILFITFFIFVAATPGILAAEDTKRGQ